MTALVRKPPYISSLEITALCPSETFTNVAIIGGAMRRPLHDIVLPSMPLCYFNAPDQFLKVLCELGEITVENAFVGADVKVKLFPLFRYKDHGNTPSPA